MKDKALALACELAGQPELVKMMEDVEAGTLDKVLVCASVGFADDRDLHERVCWYIRHQGAEPVLVPDGKPVRHPLPWLAA